ncbi:hypothetical protein OG754_31215 [Streptomyces decoyicus]|uniref:hypothetical protein n=1 Tax=Streptomyces decoyicus TaxID=249567 RepID=UPI002E2FED21|nr:hypothetical protein [Streptomyces decoyicus]
MRERVLPVPRAEVGRLLDGLPGDTDRRHRPALLYGRHRPARTLEPLVRLPHRLTA